MTATRQSATATARRYVEEWEREYAELKEDYPDRLERFIEEMSRYLAASGKSYQNYAAALRIWAGNDKKGAPKKGIPDYSCKEGESL